MTFGSGRRKKQRQNSLDSEPDNDGSLGTAQSLIASLLKGDQPKIDTVRKRQEPKGDTPKAPAKAAEAPPADEDDATTQEDASAPEADEQEPEEVEEEPKEDAEAKAGPDVPSSINDVAKVLEVEPQALLDNLKVSVKVGGKTESVPLGEALKGYTREADHRANMSKLADQQRSFGTWKDQQEKATVAAANTLAHVFTSFKDSLVGKEPDAALMSSDPDEFVRQSTLYAARQRQFDATMAKVTEPIKNAEAQRPAQVAKFAAQQQDRLKEIHPEFFDEKTGGALQKELTTYLAREGFTPQELEQLIDARTTSQAYKAMQWDKLQKAPLSDKKVKTNVQTLRVKGGNGGDVTADRRTQETQVLRRLSQTHSVDDAAAAIKLRMGAKR